MMQFTTRIPARTFGQDSDKTVLGFKPHKPACGRIPTLEGHYVFDERFFEALCLWWQWEDTRSPLLVTGPTGCGKTSGVMQFLARLNAPVLELTCRARMDKNELIGGFTPRADGFAWTDGPALLAWRYGLTLVINEFSLAPPEVWVSANDLLEGDALYVEKTGETLPRHPNARVVITDNSNFDGDAQYLARQSVDTSVIDRCWHVKLDYLSEERELALLSSRFEAQGLTGLKPLLQAAVRFARKSRDTQNTSAPSHPVSTRVLERFIAIYLKMRSAGSDGLERALSLSLTAGLAAETARYLQQVAHFEFAALV